MVLYYYLQSPPLDARGVVHFYSLTMQNIKVLYYLLITKVTDVPQPMTLGQQITSQENSKMSKWLQSLVDMIMADHHYLTNASKILITHFLALKQKSQKRLQNGYAKERKGD